MSIRYIPRLTGITLGDSGIKAQERQKIFVFDLKIPIFWTAFRYITVPLCFIAANSALKRLMHVTLFCKAVIKGSIGSDGKHAPQPMAAGIRSLAPPPSEDIRYPSIFNTPIVAILF